MLLYERKQNYGTAKEFWEDFQGESGNWGDQGRKDRQRDRIDLWSPSQPGTAMEKAGLEKLPDAMTDGRVKDARSSKPVDEEKLHQKIGQQAVEIDFLKKKLHQLGLLEE